MPELPEVETTRRGLVQCGQGATITDVWVSGHKLRIPVPADLTQKLRNQRLSIFHRRGKYLVFEFESSRVYEDRSPPDVSQTESATTMLEPIGHGITAAPVAVSSDPNDRVEAEGLDVTGQPLKKEPKVETNDVASTNVQEYSAGDAELLEPKPEWPESITGSRPAEVSLPAPSEAAKEMSFTSGQVVRDVIGEEATVVHEVPQLGEIPTTDVPTRDQVSVAGPCPCLLIHLGMSGWFCGLASTTAEIPNHSHMLLTLDNGNQLVFNDVRRFGLVDWCRLSETGPRLGAGTCHSTTGTSEWREDFRLRKMGIEPLGSDFDGEYLLERASGRRVSVKQFLMDNAVVVGIGNIYAAEILFKCGIHPLTLADCVEPQDWQRIALKTQEVLQASIEAKGTTFRDFIHGDGQVGDYAELLSVYGRKNQPCRSCETALILFRQQGRSTVYCPQCQPEPPPASMATPRKVRPLPEDDDYGSEKTSPAPVAVTPATSVKRKRKGVNTDKVIDSVASLP